MTERTRKAYSTTDLTDDQWNILKPLIPPKVGKGRNQEVDLREIVNAIFYWLLPSASIALDSFLLRGYRLCATYGIFSIKFPAVFAL